MANKHPLEQQLDYQFHQPELLYQALTHRSFSAQHNERLEFLGDGVLNFIVASLLYDRFERINEGDLSRVRSNLVKQDTLAQLAVELQLSSYLRLGEGELKSGGFNRPSILADSLEAIFGAVFLDGGFDAAYKAIKRLYQPLLEQIDPRTVGKDAKTLLQETLQGMRLELPTYTVIDTRGAAHNQIFTVNCHIEALAILTQAEGRNRRAAEQEAAALALLALDEQRPGKKSS